MSKTYNRPELVSRGSAIEVTLQHSPFKTFEEDTVIPTDGRAV